MPTKEGTSRDKRSQDSENLGDVDNKTKVTTNVEVTETEYEMDDPVGKELKEALARQKEQSRQTFQKLINENVRLEKRLEDIQGEHQEMKTQNELLKMDLKTEKLKSSELERKNKEMSAEIQTLTIAKKRNLNRRPSSEFPEGKSTRDYEYIAGPEDNDQRIQELRLRLIRLALDEEEKDRRIEELERELQEQEKFSTELQKNVDKDKIEDIRARIAEGPKDESESVRYQEKTNYVRQSEGATKSTVCVVM